MNAGLFTTAPPEGVGARVDDPPAIRAADALHIDAIERGASDIHLEPGHDGGDASLRIDGLLVRAAHFERQLFEHIIARIKLLGGLDIAERRKPQDGRYTFRDFDVRVAAIPVLGGERLTLRLHSREAMVLALDALGFDETTLSRFRALLKYGNGLIIACGPTGCGKTTTIYAALNERQSLGESLCSIEDPVEIALPGVNQIQIQPKLGLTFESAMRGLLRHDPDVIFIGELRDPQSAALAASAALCGRLVLATLHAVDACAARERLLDLGVAPRLLDRTLRAVLAQRLMRRSDVDGTYRGRVGIFELAEPESIIDRDLHDVGHPLRIDAWRQVALGRSDEPELYRVLGAPR
ncbi:MAG TPA: ATPase, T2SS/T4P/T4SS family [Candidatus Dormibacteraeota bacterium]|nr:ATPase, T2SS/T4P/T4SS family [Candidatus Dormibacteraeota bacterium]